MTFRERIILQIVVILIVASSIKSQSFKIPNHYEAEIGGYTAAVNRTPFWQQANQYGIVPTKTPILTLRASAYAGYDSARINARKLDFGYGVRLVGNVASGRNVLLPELYLKARYIALELSVGRRQEVLGLVDSTLSSGSYSWSGNSLPLPKIQLAVPSFTAIPFTKGWVSFMGSFAHGYMNPTGFVNHSMLHQKTLYLRVGRQKDVIRLYGGFTHQAIWGGKIDNLALINNPDIAKENQLPSRFRDYMYVVTGLRLPGPDDQNRLTNFDYTNRIGNHLGNVDIGADIDLVRYSLFVYRQSFFDDGSLYYLLNIADGLNGIRLRRNNPDALVRDLLVEFLNTTSQGGSQFVIDDPLRRGAIITLIIHNFGMAGLTNSAELAPLS
ncbi:MAG: capsule assembly Wzi family protein [Rudanella sp.]|nr:capsule assembly Wzi family protein [Rudanella sp.]